MDSISKRLRSPFFVNISTPIMKETIGGDIMLEYIIYAWFTIGVPVIGLYALCTTVHNLYADWVNSGSKKRRH